MQAFAAAKLRGGCMKKNLDHIMRLCAGAGGVLAVLIIGCAAVFALSTLLFENVQAAETFSGTSALLPKALEMTGFTLTTSLAAVLLVFPVAWSISVMVVFVMHAKHLMPMTRAISGFSAIPAVVFGYMGLTFLAPKAPSAWLGVTATLVLMSLMDLTLLLIRVHVKHLPALESSQALGAFLSETVLGVVVPRAARSYLYAALRMLARSMGEGVAILLVLSAYSGENDTLVTALMKAVGVTGGVVNTGYALLLVALLLILVLATNALISYCQEGGRRGKKKGVE